MPFDPSDPYVIARLRAALAEDERVAETNIRVIYAGGRLFLEGCVTNEARRLAAQALAREPCGDQIEIRNDIEVLQLSGEPTEERIG